MKGIFKLAILSAGLMASSGAFAVDGFFDIGGAQQKLTLESGSTDSTAIIAEAGIQVNDYLAFSVWAGTTGSEEVLNTQYDNYITLTDGVYGDTQTTSYESTFEFKTQYGVNVTVFIPVVDHFKFFSQVGYAKYEWESDIYDSFTDNLPSSDPDTSFESGNSECVITGNESKCGTDITSVKGKGSVSAYTGTLGAEWNISTSVAIVGAYTKTLDSELDVDSVSVRLRFRF